MVLESVLSGLLNYYLSNFVENISMSQLVVSIWAGNIVFHSLSIKETALDDCSFGLPLKVKAGHIGKLVVNIPWTNLHEEAVVIEVEDVYVLVVPDAMATYDAEKEERARQQSKQQQLAEMEEVRQSKSKPNLPQAEKQKSFAEALTFDVMKNLQAKIRNLHVRYEDSFTKPQRPFSVGVCLKELLINTADRQCTPGEAGKGTDMICKLVRLDGLSLYWNSNSALFEDMDKHHILTALRAHSKSDAGSEESRSGVDFIMRPVFCTAHVKVNSQQEGNDLAVPKVVLILVSGGIDLCLSKDQYDDLQELLESVERMSTLSRYRKYRPVVPLSGHWRDWWRYVYHTVLEETVRGRHKMWSLSRMMEHRRLMKDYRDAYFRKITGTQFTAYMQSVLSKGEEVLDVFNIGLMRQQAEARAARLEENWNPNTCQYSITRSLMEYSIPFLSWFGKSGSQNNKHSEYENSEYSCSSHEMSSAEDKNNPHCTADLEDSQADVSLPTKFVAVKALVKLKQITVYLADKTRTYEAGALENISPIDSQVIRLQLQDIYCSVKQRPAANAFLLEAKVDSLRVDGKLQGEILPTLLTPRPSQQEQEYALLTMAIETNPSDGCCDTSIKFKIKPLEITYDAQTVNTLLEFLSPPEAVQLSRLSHSTHLQQDTVKYMTASGIQHVLDQRKYTDLFVEFMSSYIVVPEQGLMTKNCRVLVVSLGQLKLTSMKQDDTAERSDAHTSGGQNMDTSSASEELVEKMSRAYEEFHISLCHTQLLSALSEDNWRAAIDAGQSNFHIFSSFSISLNFKACIFQNDPRMPRMKVAGVLSSFRVTVSDVGIQKILDLLYSIPLPDKTVTQNDSPKVSVHCPDTLPPSDLRNEQDTAQRAVLLQNANFTDLEVVFEIKELDVAILMEQDEEYTPRIQLKVESGSGYINTRTFDTEIEAYLGVIVLQYLQANLSDEGSKQLKSENVTKGPVIYLVNTSDSTIRYAQVCETCPNPNTSCTKTQLAISIAMSSLELLLYQEAVVFLMKLVQLWVPDEQDVQQQWVRTLSSLSLAVENDPLPKQHATPQDLRTTRLKMSLILDQLSVGIFSKNNLCAHALIKGTELIVMTQEQQVAINATHQQVELLDPDPDTIYRKIIQTEDRDTLKLCVVIFTEGTGGDKYEDMSCVDTQIDVEIKGLQITYVYPFINRLLSSLDYFKTTLYNVPAQKEYSVQEGVSRTRLNIWIKELTIMVTPSSSSHNCLILENDYLRISNVFKMAGQLSPIDVPSILEEIRIGLESFRISRAIMERDDLKRAQRILLEPQAISLSVQRNLCSEWYHEVPNFKVSGHLDHLTFQLVQGDHDAIWQVLCGVTSAESERVSSSVRIENNPKSPQDLPSQPLVKISEKQAVAGMAPVTPNMFLQMDFELEGLSVYLYTGDTVLTPGRAVQNDDMIVAMLDIKTISVKVCHFEDGAMNATVSALDASVDDLRVNKQSGITRVAERSDKSDQEFSKFLVVDYIQDSEQDSKIRISISSCCICLFLDFWTIFWGLFAKCPEQNDSTFSPESTDAPVAKTSSEQNCSLEVFLNAEKLEMVASENQMSVNSNVFIVDTKVSFHMLQYSDEQVLNTSYSNLQVFSSTFQNRHHVSYVIMPCDVTFYGFTRYDECIYVDIEVSDFVMHLTPATIRTMVAVYTDWTSLSQSSGSEGTVTHSGQQLSYTSFHNLWASREIHDDQFWFLRRANNWVVPLSDDQGNADEAALSRMDELMTLALPSIVVMLKEGAGQRTIPQLMATFSAEVEVKNWSSRMGVVGSIDLEVGYYNEKLAVWEPLIEHLDGQADDARRWKLNFDMQMCDDNATDYGEETQESGEPVVMLPSKMTVNFRSSDTLQMTLTLTSLDVLSDLSKAFSNASSIASVTDGKEAAISPYIFQNQTGCEMTLHLDPSFEPPPLAVSHEISLGIGACLHVYNRKTESSGWSNMRFSIKDMQDDEYKLVFQLDMFSSEHELVIKQAEKRLFRIGQCPPQGEEWSVVCNTDCRLGQRLVTFQSIVTIQNNLTFPLQVLSESDNILQDCGTVEPKQLFSLPIKVVYSFSPDLLFKPVGNTYGVSDASFNWRNVVDREVSEMSCFSIHLFEPACYFSVYRKTEEICCPLGDGRRWKCFEIRIQPTVIFCNLLPFSVSYVLKRDIPAALEEADQQPFGAVSQHTDEEVSQSDQGKVTPENCSKPPERVIEQTSGGVSKQWLDKVRDRPREVSSALLNKLRGQKSMETLEQSQHEAEEQATVSRGSCRPVEHASFHRAHLDVRTSCYLGLTWVGRLDLQKDMPEITVVEFVAGKGSQTTSLELWVHGKLIEGSLKVSLYSPYWMLNKTERMLRYRGPDHSSPVTHPADQLEPILFSFKKMWVLKGNYKVPKSERNKKIQLQIDDLKWSDTFSLDTAGSSGTIHCKNKIKKMAGAEVGVSIHLSNFGLNRIVTFTPYYMVLNNSSVSLLVKESGKEIWVDVSPGECLPFWPCAGDRDVKVQAKVKDTEEVTGPFLISKAHTTLLKLNNQYGGVYADCQVSEASTITMLQTYSPGLATVCVINHTKDYTVSFHQCDEHCKVEVKEKHSVLYAWDNALGKREILWSCGKKRDMKTNLSDGMDEFFADESRKMYWVSFLDGLQRVLLFTEKMSVVAATQEIKNFVKNEKLQLEQEINLEVQDFGLSLVNDDKQTEVAFLGITNSGVIWEWRKKRHYKALALREGRLLEAAWQDYHAELARGRTPGSRVFLGDAMEVDIKKQTLTVATVQLPKIGLAGGFATTTISSKLDKPGMRIVKTETAPVRRHLQNGIWLQYKASPLYIQFHAKLHHLQLDSQLAHAVFPVVLSPVRPPKSVSAERGRTAFIEASLYLKTHEHSKVTQIKYFKVLIQEMNVKIDQGFLLAVLELFSVNESISRDRDILFNKDIQKIEETLVDIAGLSSGEVQRNIYDYVHFSPLKIHFSFSLQAGTGPATRQSSELQASVQTIFEQSIGVVLTNVQDVVLKLSYFERSNSLYTRRQLLRQMTQHYTGQAIKQLYHLVLGLDVIGNPFGLFVGLSEGIESLFYEPYKGAIQGPEEFAEGLALGMRHLFGQTVGGAAGVVSRITGTLGRGLATLTLDDDYRTRRRAGLGHRPSSIRHSLAQSGKGLLMSMFHGITGIVRKPVEGAMKEGVKGFAKGVGKGIVGVVAHPTSGIIDFASSSFQGIQRVLEMGTEIKRLRPPRRFFPDRVLRPYNRQESEGIFILQEMDQGKYAQTDDYQSHAVLSSEGNAVLLVTNRRVGLAKHGKVFGTWDCVWSFEWAELQTTPLRTSVGIKIVLRQPQKLHKFSRRVTAIEVPVSDPKAVKMILATIHTLMAK